MRTALALMTTVLMFTPALAAPPAPAKQPARYVIEARFVERGSPPTRPATATKFDLEEVVARGLDQDALLGPEAKVLSSIDVLAIDRQPFSASTLIGDRRVHLKGAIHTASDRYVRMEINVGDCRLPPSSSYHTVTSNLMLIPGQTLLLGGLIDPSNGVRQSGIVVTLKPYDG
jgi:hypothetical protein